MLWLSLFPFATGWVGKNHVESLPVALYGCVLLLAALAYFILTRALITHHGQESILAIALGRDFKGVLSIVMYAVAIPCSFISPWIGCSLYVLVAILWIIPDRRIERRLKS